MPKITEGNKLYLYQLLSRELGMGKQALLPRVEEVLAADDILPEDLGCSDIQQLVDACPDFIKVTVFKKGRVFATVQRNAEWDKLISAADAPAEPAAGGKPSKGGKPWKAKAAGKKGVKPAKPRNKERKQREAEELARQQAEAEARAAAEAAERAEAEARAAAEAQAAAEAEAAAQAQAEAAETAEASARAPEPLPSLAEQIERERERLGITDEPEADTPPVAAPQPARRRVGRFASALSQDYAASQTPPAPSPAQASAATDSPEHALAQEGSDKHQAQKAAASSSQDSAATASPQADMPEPQASDHNASPAATPSAEPKTPAPEKPAPQPEAPREPSIKFTITYDPSTDASKDDAPLPEVQAHEFERNALPERRTPRRSHVARPTSAPPTGSDFPESFSADVHARDELLRMLYQMLPVDADIMRVLEEDWRVARSTSTLSGTRAKVTFPLRYQHEDGTPVEVTLRRASKQVAGKRWNLAYIDGDDGSGASHAAVGLEGLPAADEGAWSDLSGRSSASVSPAREFAQFAVLGSWDAVLGGLAAKAEPERWNYPGEGVGKGSRLSILREYLTVTFHRAQEQDRVARDADDSFAAFNTGLITPFAQDIYACFTPRRGDIAWTFAGFASPGAGELGERLGDTLPELPEAPSYLSSIDDVVARTGRSVILDSEALLSRQLGRLPRAFLAEQLEGNTIAREVLEQELAGGALDRTSVEMLARTIHGDPGLYRRMSRALDDAVDLSLRRAARNYRVAAPAYDPADGRTKLLIPLSLVNDAQVDCAAVLSLQRSGAYRVASVLPLMRAYTCARVVSSEMPSWLAPERVLRG